MGYGFNATMLAIFTALAPSGCVAFLLIGLVVLVRQRKASGMSSEEAASAWISRAVFMTLAVVWAAFIAAATHLGMPSNALYVVDGIGRSPLSNEVAATVGFLFFSGVYWLYSFRRDPNRMLANVLLIGGMILAVVAVANSSLAYCIDTVPAWNSWYSTASIALPALVGGCALAVGALVACESGIRVRSARTILAIGLVALVGATAVSVGQWDWLQGVSNHVVQASELVPNFMTFMLLRAAVCAGGYVLVAIAAAPVRHAGKTRLARTLPSLLGIALVLLGIFLGRIPFYDLLMGAGF